jgi:GNAT superfamily N-acetyltransferase
VAAGRPDSAPEPDADARLQHRNLEAFVRLLGRSGRGSTLFQREGVLGAVMPATPDRSIMNSVIYGDAAAFAAAYPELVEAMAAAGVRAWTVWVDERDPQMLAFLEGAGHRFDGDPAAMVLDDLATLPDAEEGLDWDAQANPVDVAEVNDLAYGYPLGTFANALAHPPADTPLRLYQARVEGEPAAVLATLDVAGDCGIYFVATRKEARGRGLARRLLHLALVEAREHGCRTSTLQASRMGYPVYERLGYRHAYAFQLWEHRE